MPGFKFYSSFCLTFILLGLLSFFMGRLDSTEPRSAPDLSFVSSCNAQGLWDANSGDPDDLLSYEGKKDTLPRHPYGPDSRLKSGEGSSANSMRSGARMRKAAQVFFYAIGRSRNWLWLTY